MLRIKSVSLAMIICVFAIPLYVGGVRAATSNKDFVEFSYEAQDSFLFASVLMSGVIAAQGRPEMAKCIDDWYSKTSALRKQRNLEMLQIMRKLPDNFPSAVILAVIERQCGKFSQ